MLTLLWNTTKPALLLCQILSEGEAVTIHSVQVQRPASNLPSHSSMVRLPQEGFLSAPGHGTLVGVVPPEIENRFGERRAFNIKVMADLAVAED